MYHFAKDKKQKDKTTLIVIAMFVLDSFESVGLFCDNELLQLLPNL